MFNLVLIVRIRLTIRQTIGNLRIHREIEGAVQASRHTIVVSTGNKLFCNYSVTSKFYLLVILNLFFLLLLGFILLYYF